MRLPADFFLRQVKMTDGIKLDQIKAHPENAEEQVEVVFAGWQPAEFPLKEFRQIGSIFMTAEEAEVLAAKLVAAAEGARDGFMIGPVNKL